jgi:hypothetical protein
MVVACHTNSTRLVCEPGAATCRAEDGWDGLPALVRAEHLEQATAVDGIELAGAPAGAAGWQLTIRNNTDEPIEFVVDDSTFAHPDGTVVSRLIRGESKGLDGFQPQPAVRIVAHEVWTGVVHVSKLMRAEDIEQRAPDLETKIHSSSDPKRRGAEADDLYRKERAEVARSVIGGTLVVALKRSSRTDRWTGTVVGSPAEPR